MMVVDLLIETLKKVNPIVMEQGSLPEDQPYPDSFFTFFNFNTYDRKHYDNKPIEIVWEFDVNFYSISPNQLYMSFDLAIRELKKAGFIMTGKGESLPSGKPSHSGRTITISYIEKEEI